MFSLPVAFSDHTPGWEMDVAAVALGANLVEKTITFDRTTPSVEHIFSLEPTDMAAFVKTIRELDTAMGSKRRIMSKAERDKRDMGRRSCFFKRDGKAGETVVEDMLDYRRPGTGIPPNLAGTLLNRKLLRNAKSGEMIKSGDVG
jgi:sialic acid synthase SpsE